MRYIFSRNNGNLGEAGCVAWMFSSKGLITIPVETAGKTEEEMFEMIIEAGAEDLQSNDEFFEVYTEPSELESVRQYLESQKIPIKAAELTQVPQNTIAVSGDQAEQVMRLIEALEDNDDVQDVYTNADFTDAESA